jgi:arabinofuranosyltransferase
MKARLITSNTILLPLLTVYLGLILFTAWVSDDAFITFRSIENFMHGYGPVYNVGERVQTFTHPLWMFMQSIAYTLTGWFQPPFGLNQLFFWNIAISLGLSLAAVAHFAFKVARPANMAVLGLLVLSLSKAFVDYSTSGLENPLSHFLAVLFFGYSLLGKKDDRRYAIGLSFLVALATLNRMDTLLIYLPALGLVVWQSANKLRTILAMLAGFLPLIVWELFSLFYYGTPFPNTASAKLDTGIETFTLLKQGAYYFLNSLRLDTVTLLVIALAVVLAVLSKNLQRIAIALGITLYLCYILSIGGDFMSGRYFSLPLLVAVLLLSTFEIKSARLYGVSLTAILVIGLLPFLTTVERRPTYGRDRENNLVFIDRHKIADERLVYRERTGLLVAVRGNSPKVVYFQGEWEYARGYPREVHVTGAMGLNGYRDGPNIHVIDVNGLADPLIARMPLEDTRDFRIGHFHHIIPEGYEETLASGMNQIQDADIALYYDKLSYIVKGPLWDWGRVSEIWKLNTGKYDYLIENISVEQATQ